MGDRLVELLQLHKAGAEKNLEVALALESVLGRLDKMTEGIGQLVEQLEPHKFLGELPERARDISEAGDAEDRRSSRIVFASFATWGAGATNDVLNPARSGQAGLWLYKLRFLTDNPTEIHFQMVPPGTGVTDGIVATDSPDSLWAADTDSKAEYTFELPPRGLWISADKPLRAYSQANTRVGIWGIADRWIRPLHK